MSNEDFVTKMNVGTRQNKGANSNVMFVEKNPTMYTLRPRYSRVFERVFLFTESSIYLVWFSKDYRGQSSADQ